MFHVKLGSYLGALDCNGWGPVFSQVAQLLSLRGALSARALALATINKCSGTDGNVVSRDQPCMPGQSAVTLGQQGGARPAVAMSKAAAAPDPTATMKSTRNRIDAALTRQYRRIQKLILDQVLAHDTRRSRAQMAEVCAGQFSKCATKLSCVASARYPV